MTELALQAEQAEQAELAEPSQPHHFAYADILTLSNRRLRAFPKWILDHDEMLILNLSFNQIPRIPDLSIALWHLAVLNLSNNELQELPPGICYLENLAQLYLSNNQLCILPSQFGRLQHLQKLELSNNQLVRLPQSIGNLVALQDIDLSHNRLVHLPGSFSNLVNLASLTLSYNKLKTLPRMIANMGALNYIDARDNRIRILPEDLWQMNWLTTLKLSSNRLVTLHPDIGNLTNLRVLLLDRNRLTTLPPSIIRLFPNPPRPRIPMINLDIASNPIEFIPPQVRRVLTQQTTIQNTVYNDGQNVHNHQVQVSLQKSIENIMAIPQGASNIPINTHQNPLIEELVNYGREGFLTEETVKQLLEYMEDDTVHSVLQVTFSEVFTAVWNMINKLSLDVPTDRRDILERLNQEMADSECKCFTGRITRLVNCLSGFTPLVNIQIADNEQIAIIIQLAKNTLDAQPDGYNVATHREMVRLAMTERGYSPDVIDIWIEHIE